jgi:hypothetical protein
MSTLVTLDISDLAVSHRDMVPSHARCGGANYGPAVSNSRRHGRARCERLPPARSPKENAHARDRQIRRRLAPPSRCRVGDA